jgi:hypothetical protein
VGVASIRVVDGHGALSAEIGAGEGAARGPALELLGMASGVVRRDRQEERAEEGGRGLGRLGHRAGSDAKLVAGNGKDVGEEEGGELGDRADVVRDCAEDDVAAGDDGEQQRLEDDRLNGQLGRLDAANQIVDEH